MRVCVRPCAHVWHSAVVRMQKNLQTLLFLSKSKKQKKNYINADAYVPLSPEPKGNRLSELGCNARPSMKTLLLFDGLFVFSIIVLFIRNNLSPEIFIPWKVFFYTYIYNPCYDGSVSVNRRLTSFLNVTKLNLARDEQSPDRQTVHSCGGKAFKDASKLDESCRGGGGERTKQKRKQNKGKY